MYKIIKAIVLVVALQTVFASCHKTKDIENPLKKENLKEIKKVENQNLYGRGSGELPDDSLILLFDQVGQYHNVILTSLYDSLYDLREQLKTNPLPIADAKRMVKNIFFNHLSADVVTNYSAIEYQGESVRDVGDINTSMVTFWENQTDASMDADLASAIDDLEDLIRDTLETNINNIISDYNTLMEEKVSLIDDYQSRAAFIACASTAKYSSIYWDEHKEEWDELAEGILGRRIPEEVMQILIADAQGGLTGGIRGAIVGGVTGLLATPAGSVPGALLGGFAGAVVGGSISSAINVVRQLFHL